MLPQIKRAMRIRAQGGPRNVTLEADRAFRSMFLPIIQHD